MVVVVVTSSLLVVRPLEPTTPLMLVVILCSLIVTSELLLALATFAMAVMFLSELVRLRTRMLRVAPSGLLEELALPATIVTVEVVNQVATSLWLEPFEMPKALMLLEAFPLQEAKPALARPARAGRWR